jgi:membrane-bound ClpP family serine protease
MGSVFLGLAVAELLGTNCHQKHGNQPALVLGLICLVLGLIGHVLGFVPRISSWLR